MANYNFWKIITLKKSKFFILNCWSKFYSDVIVKYFKLEDSLKAFTSLIEKYNIVYVPTKIDSDRANNYQHMITETNDHDARDATITLNMLKIKNIKQFEYGPMGQDQLFD